MNLRNLTDYYTLFLLFSKKEFYSLSVIHLNHRHLQKRHKKLPAKSPQKHFAGSMVLDQYNKSKLWIGVLNLRSRRYIHINIADHRLHP